MIGGQASRRIVEVHSRRFIRQLRAEITELHK